MSPEILKHIQFHTKVMSQQTIQDNLILLGVDEAHMILE
jgi:hypothetical protein